MKALAVALIVVAGSAEAGGFFSGFTAFSEDPEPEPEVSVPLDGIPALSFGEASCEAAINGAERRYGLPQGLLMQIGLTEAGHQGRIWPWTVNAEGKSYYFASRAEAVGFVHAQEARGVQRIDTGCLQINRYWHPEAFASVEASFDPVLNADYAAQYLNQLRRELGGWAEAVGAYHSRDPERSRDYAARVASAKSRAVALAAQVGQAARSPRPAQNLLPSISADLASVDVGAILRAAHVPVAKAPEPRAPLPDPKPGQGLALFVAADSSALIPRTAKPLY